MSPTPERVKQLLESADFGDRLKAVNLIRELEPAIGFELLKTAAADSNVRVRYAAVSQFTTLGPQNRTEAEALLRQALMTDPEPDVQAAAADALGGLQCTDAFEDLQSVYHGTEEWLVKFSIIAALGELGDRRAFDLLQSALDSSNELVATAAIGSLGELKDDRAIPILLKYVDADDWQVRHRVVQALSQFDTPETKAALKTLSQDRAAAVAETAKHHLGN
ncbi:MAG: HEAT repeat domain-containing protein [Leptolyngbyaceae cyanobacterium T60_A2020_046]|nr:HEAT repeat domain-containing protein [Leptolyngbyaceae cyanobacterium T60_A2020_046]